jgi:hypothetical protein
VSRALEGNGGVAHGFEGGRVRLLLVLAAANGREAAFGQSGIFVHEGGFPIVTAVVVGDGDEIETGVEQAIIGAGVAAKVVRLGDRRAQLRDDAFQIADGQVEAAQELGGVGEGIGVVGRGCQHVAVDGAAKHDIAGKGQRDGSGRRGRRWCWRVGWLSRCLAAVWLRRGVRVAARQAQQGEAARCF